MAKVDLSGIGSGVDLSNINSGIDLNNINSGVDLSNVGSGIDLSNISSGIPEQKGFFETLRNPIDLMRYESLPVAAYQYMSGNTKEVQAKKAQQFIDNNPNLAGTPEYTQAQATLERYGYTIDQEPFSVDALKQAIQMNPGALGGEFVNALLADPYLLFTPYLLGGNALAKFFQANKALAKVPRISRGLAIGTAAAPEAAAYSVIQQLGEDGEFDTNRVAVETGLGGAGGLALGMAFGGSITSIGKYTNQLDNVTKDYLQTIVRANRGEPEAIARLKSFRSDGSGVPQTFDDISVDAITNLLKREFKYNDKNANAMYQQIKADHNEIFKNFYDKQNKTTLLKRTYENAIFPVTAGTIFGAGAYIGSDDPQQFAIVGGAALGAATFGKVGVKALTRASQAKRGRVQALKLDTEWDSFINEIKSTGVDPKTINIKENKQYYVDLINQNKRFSKDLAELGEARDLLDRKAVAISRYIFDNMESFSRLGNMYGHKLNLAFKKEFPVHPEREVAVLDFIQQTRYKEGANKGKLKVTEKDLSPEELKAARAAQKYFEDIHKMIKDDGVLSIKFRQNFLPGFWQRSAMISDNDAKSFFASMFTDTKSGPEFSGRLPAENSKKITSYSEGIDKGLEPRTTNLGEIVALYNNALYKALSERTAIDRLLSADIPGLTSGTGKTQKIIYTTIPKDVDASDYVKFGYDRLLEANPRNIKKYRRVNELVEAARKSGKVKNLGEIYKLREDLISKADMAPVYVYKEALPHIKMTFDAVKDKGFFRAISNFNFLQKRLSVGYSFFHAAALFENMFFAGVKISKIATVAGLDKVPGIKYFVPKTISAKRMMNEGGNFDDYEAGLRAGVIFSHPEDIGYHRFYDLFAGANRIADRIGSPFAKWVAQQGINKLVVKPFQFIDAVTWDHVYNSGKLYTFQTARQKLLIDPANENVPMHILDRKAAEFTNDAYGGLNWRQIYEDTTNPIMKKILGSAYTPSGRRLMQLALFAPDWTTANLRIIGKAFPGFNRDPIGRKLYTAYALRAALIFATFGSALQFMFTGKSLLENKDPTKIDLGNGMNMVFSKQLMEPLHWAVHPYKTLVSKQGSTLKLTQQLLFNKKYLTSPYPSPITDRDLSLLYQARDYGLQIGESLVPFAFRNPIQQMMKDGVDFQDAINFLLGEFGHPVYPEGRKFKYPGLNIGN